MQEVRKIYDIMKSANKWSGTKHLGDYGVEIETETKKKYEYPQLTYWNTVRDNSLRDFGVEYVLKAPMNIAQLEKALDEFNSCEKKYKFEKSSVSTSVHVHMNMLDQSYLTMSNIFTVYSLLENIFIRYSGPDRLSNLFCLPICDAEGVKDNLTNLLSYVNRNMFNKVRVSADRCKYGAINPAPLSELGTIEFRSFRGETDIKVIQRWVEILDKMKSFCCQEGLHPPHILELWKENGDTILEVIFGEYAKELRVYDPKTKKDISSELIRQNLKYAADIAFVSKDWSKFGILKIKPVYKEKIKAELDEISIDLLKHPFDSLPYHERLVVLECYHRKHTNVRVVDADGDI
jgi:hypothetical protein